MRRIALPWHKLGLPVGHGGTLFDLKAHYGNEWNAISKYFLPTKRLATSINCPKPGGDGCPRKVVEHSFNDIVAVCGNSPKECEPVRLSRQDLIIYELKTDKLLSDTAGFLRIQGREPVQFMHQTWELGIYVGQDRSHISVYVSILSDPDQFQVTAISLIAQMEKPFFLLTPSRDLWPVQLIKTVNRAGVILVGLDELQEGQATADGADLLGKCLNSEYPKMENENIFRLEKEHLRIIFRGQPYTIRQSVGMKYITHLIQRAYNNDPEIHVSDLYYLVHKKPVVKETFLSKMTSEQVSELGLDVSGLDEGVDLITPEGKKWVGYQIKNLKGQIEEAEKEGNTGEALRLREKKEDVEDYLKKVLGLSGRVRKSSDSNERMRKSISKAIDNALFRLGKNEGDELALYLHDHLDKGLFCSFRKDPNIFWKITKK